MLYYSLDQLAILLDLLVLDFLSFSHFGTFLVPLPLRHNPPVFYETMV